MSALSRPGEVSGRAGKGPGVLVGIWAAVLLAFSALLAFGGSLVDAAGARLGVPLRAALAGLSAVGLVGLIAILPTIGGLRAVTKYTFTQCIRMKVAAVFIVFLVVALAAMPSMSGDGTLAGRIRSFLSYSTWAVLVLLSIVTVFLGAGLVSSDVRDKQIFSLASKPLPRWQYIVGRWLGLIMVNGVLLLVAAVAIYLSAQYLRTREESVINANDRRAVETEVFTARAKVHPAAAPIDQAVERRIRRLIEKGDYDSAVEAYKIKARGDEQLAKAILAAEIRKQELKKLQTAPPGAALKWTFSNVKPLGGTTSLHGVLDAPPDRRAGRIMIRSDHPLTGVLSYGYPLQVNGVDGHAEKVWRTKVLVRLSQEAMARGAIATLAKGKPVVLSIGPTVQITYKASPAKRPPHGTSLSSHWQVVNPTEGSWYQETRNDAPRLPATLTVPARLVGSDGRMNVTYLNLPNRRTGFATSVTVLRDDVAVLYRVGGFEGNFLRTMLLVLVQLMFVAALSVVAGSFVTFPIACLIAFVTWPFSWLAREFLGEAVYASSSPGGMDALTWVGHYVFRLMSALLPDFTTVSATASLVDGMNISWSALSELAVVALALRGLLLLGAACLLFHRRELARVQV